MSISFFRNDRKTAMDELVLSLIVVVCLVIGIVLAVWRPAFWIVTSKATALVGVILALFGVMYIPCLIYRLVTNDRK